MGFRFRKSVGVIPGVRINLSTGGASLSLGGRGTTLNVGKRGLRGTLDLPGSGAFYTKDVSWQQLGQAGDQTRGKAQKSSASPVSRSGGRAGGGSAAGSAAGGGRQRPPDEAGGQRAAGIAPVQIRGRASLELGYFDRLRIPNDEEPLIDGLRELSGGGHAAALKHFEKALHCADGCFLAGAAALQFGIYTDAITYLEQAWQLQKGLGKTLAKHGISVWVSIRISDQLTAHIQPNNYGVLLALSEANQQLRRNDKALSCLRQLVGQAPQDVVVRLALAELLSDQRTAEADVSTEIASLGQGIENDTELHCALLYYQGLALKRLGLHDGAKAAFTKALSKRKDRPLALLLALRYERAQLFLQTGEEKRAREDFERIFADDPGYRDVERLLGKA